MTVVVNLYLQPPITTGFFEIRASAPRSTLVIVDFDDILFPYALTCLAPFALN